MLLTKLNHNLIQNILLLIRQSRVIGNRPLQFINQPQHQIPLFLHQPGQRHHFVLVNAHQIVQ